MKKLSILMQTATTYYRDHSLLKMQTNLTDFEIDSSSETKQKRDNEEIADAKEDTSNKLPDLFSPGNSEDDGHKKRLKSSAFSQDTMEHLLGTKISGKYFVYDLK